MDSETLQKFIEESRTLIQFHTRAYEQALARNDITFAHQMFGQREGLKYHLQTLEKLNLSEKSEC